MNFIGILHEYFSGKFMTRAEKTRIKWNDPEEKFWAPMEALPGTKESEKAQFKWI